MELSDSGPQLTETDIVNFEERHSVKMPDDYKGFMLAHNGGYPRYGAYKMEDGGGTVVSEFYAIGTAPPYNLDNMAQTFEVPRAYKDGILVIGRDVGGSEILLSMRGESAGTVYFLNREVTLRPKGSLKVIASSFGAFINRLEPLPYQKEVNNL